MSTPDHRTSDGAHAALLDAIDATLEGRAVDPDYAEVAELSLLLAAERPAMEAATARSLDERVLRGASANAPTVARPRGWLWRAPAGAAAVAALAALVVVAGLSARGSSSASSSSATAPAASLPAPASSGATQGSHSGASGSLGTSTSSAGVASPSSASPSSASPSSASPRPPSNGRQLEQSAELALTTPSNRVDDVAQEVFDAVGAENGTVSRSTVTQTGGTGGYADIQLTVPSSVLAQTMAKLSHLSYASVSSRTDNAQDVTDRYSTATGRLDDARALRTALLKQLANASTTQQIDSLKAQIHDAEASIAADGAALGALRHQIAYSQISLSINPALAPAIPARAGFTFGTAAHDAGRVLIVAAGVALIALAGLTPAALAAALAWWIASTVRRHRREHELDLA
jgi:hypothetical protein